MPLLGFDFNYRAMKKVHVRSWKLACMSSLLFTFVTFYCLGYMILYDCKHFGTATPKGTARLQLQRPVKDHCDPEKPWCKSDYTPLSKLNYCHGTKSSDHAVHSKSFNHTFPCKYWDEHQMQDKGLWASDHIFIPTRITRQHQQLTKGCDEGEPCDNVYKFNDEGVNDISEHGDTFFIADVERFTLLIDHAYTVDKRHLGWAEIETGAAHNYIGYWQFCDTLGRGVVNTNKDCKTVRIPCLDKKNWSCEMHTREHPEKPDEEAEKREIIGILGGDIIPIGQLLHMVGADLGNANELRHDRSLRFSGVGIQIDVVYSNMEFPKTAQEFLNPKYWWSRFLHPAEVHYTYRAHRLPVEKYKHFHTMANSDGTRRILDDAHGIFIYVNVQGEIRYFDQVKLLMMCATFFALYKIANGSINFYAEVCWRHRGMYKKSKLDSTIDLNADESCCCLDIPNTLTSCCRPKPKEAYKPEKSQFIRDMVSLDGEALAWGGALLYRIADEKQQNTPEKEFNMDAFGEEVRNVEKEMLTNRIRTSQVHDYCSLIYLQDQDHDHCSC